MHESFLCFLRVGVGMQFCETTTVFRQYVFFNKTTLDSLKNFQLISFFVQSLPLTLLVITTKPLTMTLQCTSRCKVEQIEVLHEGNHETFQISNAQKLLKRHFKTVIQNKLNHTLYKLNPNILQSQHWQPFQVCSYMYNYNEEVQFAE